MNRIRAAVLAGLLAAIGCAAERDGAPGVAARADTRSGDRGGACLDADGDGFGDACDAGPDCDDGDPEVHDGCRGCATPDSGCACDASAQPRSCFLPPTAADAVGSVMCHEGTRYCRDGVWSGCEDVLSYEKQVAPETAALIDADAGPVQCDACSPVCFRIVDNLDPVSGGLTGGNSNSQVDWATGGGLTLAEQPDGGMPTYIIDGGVVEPVDCTPGTAPDRDCDGVDDVYDPYPDAPPFATANPTLFLDIPAGQTGVGQIDLGFFLTSADVYFLVDQSASMTDERDRLKADLTTGDFINDPSFDCADYDFDFVPNNELKDQGIIGAIRCIIRESNFGTGFFREIPFPTYADNAQVVFDNYQDLTADVAAVQAAVSRLNTIGNDDWPEAAMLALNNLVTADGMYFGIDKRGVPPRYDCPASTWGYPCFRDDAIPIIVMFTDAMMHNGPSDNAYAYDPSQLAMQVGTDATYVPVANGNEAFASAHDALDLTGRLVTLTGDTTGMSPDVPASDLSCLSVDGGPDALFAFQLSQQRAVTISSAGSRFDTVLGLFSGALTTPVTLPDSDNSNESAAPGVVQALGEAVGGTMTISGDTSSMGPDYLSDTLGCDGDGQSADAAYSFTVSQDNTTVVLSTEGSAFDTVLSLYDAPPPAVPTPATNASNTNTSVASALLIGEAYDGSLAVSGDTAAPGIDATFAGSDLGCGAADAARDAVYQFDLASPTRVAISTEGSGFDTVLALAQRDETAVTTSNEAFGTAHDMGALDGRIVRVTGTTTSMTSDYEAAEMGCGAADGVPDAAFRFRLDTPREVTIDTTGTTFDSVIALYDASGGVTSLVSTDQEATDLAQDLGVVNGSAVRVTGGNTTGMTADYDASQVTCASAATADAAYRFSVNAATRVRIDTSGSSFDTAVSLHDGSISPPPGAYALSVPTSAEDRGTAYKPSQPLTGNTLVLTGNTQAMRADQEQEDPYDCHHSSNGDGPDAFIEFEVTATGTYEFQLDSSFTHGFSLFESPRGPSDPYRWNHGTAGQDLSNAIDLGTMDGWAIEGSGRTARNSLSNTDCGAPSNAKDAIYRFSLASQRTLRFDSESSPIDSILQVYDASDDSLLGCEDDDWWPFDNDADFELTLDPGDYYAVVTRWGSAGSGDYRFRLRDTVQADPDFLACEKGSTSSTITRTLTAGTYYAVVKGYSGSHHGDFTLTATDTAAGGGNSHLLACNDDAGPGNTSSLLEADLGPNQDYWVVVKGGAAAEDGHYTLNVQDVDVPPTSPMVGCDNDSGGAGASQYTATLPAGDYWVVLGGESPGDHGDYTLQVRDTSAAIGTVLSCDDDSGSGTTSYIEEDLSAGSYYVVVKGDSAGDQGATLLSVRDVQNHPHQRIACDRDGGSGESSHLQQTLNAGTYYVVVSGDAPADRGSYSLRVQDVNAGSISPVACNDDGGRYYTSVIEQTLNPGNYLVALKGYNSSATGKYQLTVGGGNAATDTYVPPTWQTTAANLQAAGAKVIPVLSCQDDPDHGDADGDCNRTRAQATALANATSTLGKNLQPLVFDIDRDGSGLSKNVVDGITSLANYLEMDVQLVVDFNPDTNPGFIVTVQAVDEPGDGCSGIANGLEHLNCVPGATPRFLISFENPSAAPVPLNPSDPNGGYNFRAQLIADGSYTVDQIPIYIVPEDVDPSNNPPSESYHESGSYWQDVASPGCEGNQRPDWRDLSWNAELPDGTEAVFSACTAPSADELGDCTPVPIARVRGLGTCAADTDCAEGYCDVAAGACQVVTGAACMGDNQCPVNATCNDSGVCLFASQPVYIASGLGAGNFQPYLRMGIDLSGTPPITSPPIVHSWEMTYLCNTVD